MKNLQHTEGSVAVPHVHPSVKQIHRVPPKLLLLLLWGSPHGYPVSKRDPGQWSRTVVLRVCRPDSCMEPVPEAFCTPQPIPQLTFQEDSPGGPLGGHPKQHLCFPGLRLFSLSVYPRGLSLSKHSFHGQKLVSLAARFPQQGTGKAISHMYANRLLSSNPVGLSPSHSGHSPAHKSPFFSLPLPCLSYWPLSVLR